MTEKYKLKKPEAEDFYNVEDNNDNMDIIDEELGKLNETIGDKNELPTEDKSSLVNAIKEVFQLGNEKKQNLVTNLIAMGVTCSISESWESLLAKVLDIVTGTDISDTTAIASHVLETDYFYNAQCVKTKGTMVDRSCVNGNELDIVNPSYPRQTIHDYTVGYTQYGKWGRNENREGLIVPAPSGYFNNIDSGDLSYVYVPASSLRSELGITADKILSGNTICGVEGSASVGKKFASGYIANVEYNSGDVIHQSCYYYSGGITSTNFRYIDITCSFVPSLIIVVCDLASGTNNSIYTAAASKYTNNNPDNMQFNAFLCENQRFEGQTEVTFGTTTRVPFSSSTHTGKVNITWYAYE